MNSLSSSSQSFSLLLFLLIIFYCQVPFENMIKPFMIFMYISICLNSFRHFHVLSNCNIIINRLKIKFPSSTRMLINNIVTSWPICNCFLYRLLENSIILRLMSALAANRLLLLLLSHHFHILPLRHLLLLIWVRFMIRFYLISLVWLLRRMINCNLNAGLLVLKRKRIDLGTGNSFLNYWFLLQFRLLLRHKRRYLLNVLFWLFALH